MRKAKLLKRMKPRFLPPFRLMGKGMASFVMEVSQGVVIFAFNAALLSLVGEVGGNHCQSVPHVYSNLLGAFPGSPTSFGES